MVDSSEVVTAGQRLRRVRLAQGMTLQATAALAGISHGYLSKLENDVKPLNKQLTIENLATALRVSPTELAPDPQAETSGRPTGRYRPGTDDGELLTLIQPVRAALDLLDLPPDDIEPRSITDLSTDVRRVNRLAQAARYKPMAKMLPGLLSELHAAANMLPAERDREIAWSLLALASRCGHSVGIAIGLDDLSVASLQRMDWAASRSGDLSPGLRAAREYLRVTAYLRARDYEACWRLNEAGFAHVAGVEPAVPGAEVVRGQLHLSASIIAAQTGDQAAMGDHLDEAERIAEGTGEQTERFWFGFGPTNVRVHRVMALSTAGEHGHAVQAADGLRFPSDWLPTRICHHHLDLARAWRWLNKPDHALAELVKARQVAPGQAQRHPLARDTVSALLRASRRPSAALTDYAAWIGNPHD